MKSFGCSIISNFAAGRESFILYACTSNKKKLISLPVLLLSHSIALLCSALAFLTIHTITPAFNPDA